MSEASFVDAIPSLPKSFIIKGSIVHSLELESITIIEDSFIAVKNGKIVAVEPSSSLEATQANLNIGHVVDLKPGQFLMPGLIDSHIHAPQFPNIGLGLDKPLLEWLEAYTFPLEKKYSDVDFARKVYRTVLKRTLRNGTTTACYYATIHLASSLVLADMVHRYGQRALIGKVNMNLNCPEGYCETTEDSLRDTEAFIKAIRDRHYDLVEPVVTPRFALSCDMDLMVKLAAIAREKRVHIQTHISENKSEIAAVKELYPDCKTYSDVYDTANLLTSKTVLAHGVHLEDGDLSLLAARSVAVAHCPNSNTSLKSGACDVRRLLDAGLTVGLGTDVAGGYSVSMLDAIRSTLAVSAHVGFCRELYRPLDYQEAFYLATMGSARALSLDEQIGNFLPGKHFDALIVDVNAADTPIDVLTSYTTETLLQKFLYLGDDRNILKVFVAGRLVRDAAYDK